MSHKRVTTFAIVAAIVLAVTIAFALNLAKSRAVADHGATTLDWADLRSLDNSSGRANRAVAKSIADAELVRVAGFLVPLDDYIEEAAEFLLVPYPMACIHAPTPPSSQIVHIEMDGQRRVAFDGYVPVWVYGRLHIDSVRLDIEPIADEEGGHSYQFDIDYTIAAYRMESNRIEEFQELFRSEHVQPLIDPCERAWSYQCLEWKISDFLYRL